MEYRRLGFSGLKLSALSFGSWVTFGTRVARSEARELLALAYDCGVNFYDNAEVYSRGESERIMGDALADLRWSRDSYCVSSKVMFGAVDDPKPTQHGLSRKHVIDACHQALQRLRVDYLDLYFCHRPDPDTPIEETVAAMDTLIRQGKVLYWGTSEWPAEDIQRAHAIAGSHHMYAPLMEQPQYNLMHRERVEQEYEPLYAEFGLGLTIWSPLASGLLTGKYNAGVPAGSRFSTPGYEWLGRGLTGAEGADAVAKVKRLSAIAAELKITPAQLAIAWCLKNPHVSTVILGATSTTQLEENLAAIEALDSLDAFMMQRVERAANGRAIGGA